MLIYITIYIIVIYILKKENTKMTVTVAVVWIAQGRESEVNITEIKTEHLGSGGSSSGLLFYLHAKALP